MRCYLAHSVKCGRQTATARGSCRTGVPCTGRWWQSLSWSIIYPFTRASTALAPVCPGPRPLKHYVTFRNMRQFLYGGNLLPPRPTLKLEGRFSSAVRYRLLNTFAPIFIIIIIIIIISSVIILCQNSSRLLRPTVSMTTVPFYNTTIQQSSACLVMQFSGSFSQRALQSALRIQRNVAYRKENGMRSATFLHIIFLDSCLSSFLLSSYCKLLLSHQSTRRCNPKTAIFSYFVSILAHKLHSPFFIMKSNG
jgi:hypothetical protein